MVPGGLEPNDGVVPEGPGRRRDLLGGRASVAPKYRTEIGRQVGDKREEYRSKDNRKKVDNISNWARPRGQRDVTQ